MRYNALGKTGLRVSITEFGASSLGEEFGAIDPSEGKQAVDFAIDHGINYFDVAPYYGRTLAEKRLGEFFNGKSNKISIAIKVCRYSIYEVDFSASRIMRSVDESLSRLQTDYIDVFQVHDVEFGKREQIIWETWPAMQKLKTQGKVKFIGITG